MGNTNPSSQLTSQFIKKCWQPISSQLWRNKITFEIIKEKRLVFQSQQEMKYVFACLVRRMNDYHPNVMKVFYLRKLYQKGSVCTCSQKHTIQFYVENVECTLQKYIIKNCNRKNQGSNRFHNSNRKCVCMQIVKAAAYLKQRYGSFIVSNKNVWIQQQRVQHQDEDRKIEASTQQKRQPLETMKAKLWISATQEQNFPDKSCQEREMCFSIVGLIKNYLVGNGLCKCLTSMEVLQRLMHMGSIKELEEVIRKERQEKEKNLLKGSNVIKVEPKVAFTRTRAYSTQDSSTQNQQYFAPNFPYAKFRPCDSTQQQPQRKYSLVEQIRKPTASRRVQFITPPMMNQNLTFVKQGRTNDNSKNARNIKDNYFIQESGLAVRPQGVNQKTRITKMYSDHKNNEKQNNLSVQQLKNIQSINPRAHYNRHLNNFIINKPIISLADMTGDDISAVSNQTIKAGRVGVEKTKQSESKDPDVREDMNENSDKQNGFQPNRNENEETSKSELRLNVITAQEVERSQDKVTDPTDRTRFDNSLKEEQKKQHQGVNTSRKNISTIPISMNSSSLAGQLPKLIVHSYGHQRKVSVEHRDFGQETIEKMDQQIQKKESAASSKSQKNYISYHGGSDKSMEKEEQKSNILKKRVSGINILPKKDIGGSEGNISKDHNEFYDIHIKQPSKIKQHQLTTTITKQENLVQYLCNEQLSCLNQSKYMTRAQDDHQVRNQLRKSLRVDDAEKVSILECVSGELQERYYNRRLVRQEESGVEKDEGISLDMLQRLKQTSIMQPLPHHKPLHPNPAHYFTSSKNQSSLHSFTLQQPISTRGKVPSFITHGRNTSNEAKNKQLIKRQSEHPASSPYEKFRLWQQNEKQISYQGEKSIYDIGRTGGKRVVEGNEYQYGDIQYSQHYQQQHIAQTQQLSNHQLLSQNTLPQFSQTARQRKKLSLKQQFSQLLNFDNEQQIQSERQKKVRKLHQRQISVAVSIYNSSEYKQSNNISKRTSEIIGDNYQKLVSGRHKRFNIPIDKYQKNKFTKKFKQQQQQVIMKIKQQSMNDSNNNQNDYVLQTIPQNILRMTSSGHEDNSIRQKVISKKAQFAQLKSQMNILLL